MYRLTSDGQWDDKGTGQVSVEWMEVGPDTQFVQIWSSASSLHSSHTLHHYLQPSCLPSGAGQLCRMILACCHLMPFALQQSSTTGLVVISEEQDTRTLLIHEIQTQDIYQRQGGNTWARWHHLTLSCVHFTPVHQLAFSCLLVQMKPSSPGQMLRLGLMLLLVFKRLVAATLYGAITAAPACLTQVE